MATRTGRKGPKTRKACLTCRQRRVKCDEERPHCQRRIKAGRSCEGYQMLLIDGATGVANGNGAFLLLNSSTSLLSAFAATHDEWQAYRLYAQRMSSTLGGPFDTDLWQDLMIRISYDDAAVRNGIFTLGNLFRHRMDGNTGHLSVCWCTRCVQALKCYNRAIASFASRLASVEDPVSGDIALASCALFICIEYYRQNDRNAIALINKGCGILSENLQHRIELRTRDINPWLRNLFARLRVLSASFGRLVDQPLTPQYTVSNPLQEPFAIQVDIARNSLYDIMTAALRLRRYSAESLIPILPWITSSVPLEYLSQERDEILSRLRIWNEHFMPLQERLKSNQAESSVPSLVLYCHFLQTRIYVETSLELSQDCYDKYISDFQWIADAVELCQRQSSTSDNLTDFSFESCFLSTLYLCALKCREPRTRRQLIELMHLSREKEGPWHRAESITVASRVIELEEGHGDFIPIGNADVRTPFRGRNLFHDVLCRVNYVTAGKTKVDIMYILHLPEDPTHEWLAMKETLVVDECKG